MSQLQHQQLPLSILTHLLCKLDNIIYSTNRNKKVFFRSSHQRCSIKKGVLKDFTIFAVFLNYSQFNCARVSFLIKLQDDLCNFIKKKTLAQVFYCEFCEIFKIPFFIKHLWATASVFSNSCNHKTIIPPSHCVKSIQILFMVRIFLYSGQKKLRISTLFMQCL